MTLGRLVPCVFQSDSLSLRALYQLPPFPPGKHLWYQLNMMPVGPQGQSARFYEEKNTLPLAEVELRFLGFPTRSVITIRMTLPPLRFNTFSCISEKVIVLVMSLRFNYCMYCVACLCLLISVWRLARGVLFSDLIWYLCAYRLWSAAIIHWLRVWCSLFIALIVVVSFCMQWRFVCHSECSLHLM